MANAIVQCQAPTGLTLTLSLYAFSSDDTLANSGGADTLTEKTNNKGLYQATVTEGLSGWHWAKILDGSGNLIAHYAVWMSDTTNIHRCVDLADVYAVGGTAQTSRDIGGTLGAAGAGLTAIPWNPAWDAEVQSEVQDCVEANYLDQLLAVTYNSAVPPGDPDSLLNSLVEDDLGVPRFTTNALEQAPTGGSAPTVGEIADAVWDELTDPHSVSGSFGEAVVAIDENVAALAILAPITAVVTGTPTTTEFDTGLTSFVDGFFNDSVVVFESGALYGETGKIVVSSAQANGRLTFDEPWTSAPAPGDIIRVLSGHAHTKSQLADAIWTHATRILTAGTNIALAKGVGVTGFNDLDAAGVRAAIGLASANLDSQIDAIPTANEVRNAVTGYAGPLDLDANGRVRLVDGTGPGEIDLTSGLVKVSGTLQTLDALDTAQDAQHAATVAAIAALNNLSSAQAQAAAAAAIAAYDPPTKAELDSGLAGLNDLSLSDIMSTQLAESYAANGVVPTLTQAVLAIHQKLMSFGYVDDESRVYKFDGTLAFTGTLDSVANPTSDIRAV